MPCAFASASSSRSFASPLAEIPVTRKNRAQTPEPRARLRTRVRTRTRTRPILIRPARTRPGSDSTGSDSTDTSADTSDGSSCDTAALEACLADELATTTVCQGGCPPLTSMVCSDHVCRAECIEDGAQLGAACYTSHCPDDAAGIATQDCKIECAMDLLACVQEDDCDTFWLQWQLRGVFTGLLRPRRTPRSEKIEIDSSIPTARVPLPTQGRLGSTRRSGDRAPARRRGHVDTQEAPVLSSPRRAEPRRARLLGNDRGHRRRTSLNPSPASRPSARPIAWSAWPWPSRARGPASRRCARFRTIPRSCRASWTSTWTHRSLVRR